MIETRQTQPKFCNSLVKIFLQAKHFTDTVSLDGKLLILYLNYMNEVHYSVVE
jgi:hypothetical protein